MRFSLFSLCLLFFFTANSVYSQNQQSLDEAVQNSVRYLQSRFPRGTRAAFIAVQSDNQQISDFAYNRFSNVLVNSGWFTVVERSSAALADIQREMERHLNFEVSEETELAIGKQLGAEILISSSLKRSGQNWQFDLRAVRVENAERAAQWSAENIRHDQALDSIVRNSPSNTSGLRNAIQEWNTDLVLEESSNNQGGYGFTVTVYRNNAPANRSLLQAEVTISFLQGRRVLHQSEPYYITESSETLLARRIAERVRADRTFFTRINETIR